mmetsp:Transcript_24091/g.55640  ORF Transcript_24091/g.55640 Transcript_24091/m.55640 type:complete len:122 (+) Transcript_24091:107-472(+)
MHGIHRKVVRWATSADGPQDTKQSSRGNACKERCVPTTKSATFGITLGSVTLLPGDLLLATASMELERFASRQQLGKRAADPWHLPLASDACWQVEDTQDSARTNALALVEGYPAYIPTSL